MMFFRNVCSHKSHTAFFIVTGMKTSDLTQIFLQADVSYSKRHSCSHVCLVAGVMTPICVVSGAQFLTRAGWVDLHNNSYTEPPFRLFRDEGRTFLQVLYTPSHFMLILYTAKHTNKQTLWPLVRKRTIPTERPPLVGEI
jgi:hypothetical protein